MRSLSATDASIMMIKYLDVQAHAAFNLVMLRLEEGHTYAKSDRLTTLLTQQFVSNLILKGNLLNRMV